MEKVHIVEIALRIIKTKEKIATLKLIEKRVETQRKNIEITIESVGGRFIEFDSSNDGLR